MFKKLVSLSFFQILKKKRINNTNLVWGSLEQNIFRSVEKVSVPQCCNAIFLLHVQAPALGEGPVETTSRPGQRPVGQQQSICCEQNLRGDLSHPGETGKNKQPLDHIPS